MIIYHPRYISTTEPPLYSPDELCKHYRSNPPFLQEYPGVADLHSLSGKQQNMSHNREDLQSYDRHGSDHHIEACLHLVDLPELLKSVGTGHTGTEALAI